MEEKYKDLIKSDPVYTIGFNDGVEYSARWIENSSIDTTEEVENFVELNAESLRASKEIPEQQDFQNALKLDELASLPSEVTRLTEEVSKLREELGYIISTGKMWEQCYELDINERTLVEMAEDAVRDSDKRIAAALNPLDTTSQDESEE
jgi:hypothetical protein